MLLRVIGVNVWGSTIEISGVNAWGSVYLQQVIPSSRSRVDGHQGLGECVCFSCTFVYATVGQDSYTKVQCMILRVFTVRSMQPPVRLCTHDVVPILHRVVFALYACYTISV